jgi:hypothetical protein
LSQDEALAQVLEGEGVELLNAELTSEAEARRRADACGTFMGHPTGVWLLLVRGTFEGMMRTMHFFIDASSGEQLCGEEIMPTLPPTETSPAGPSPTPGPESPTRIVIPTIEVDAPIVEGDNWEQLKLGVGHHIDSANPGEQGNLDVTLEVHGEQALLEPVAAGLYSIAQEALTNVAKHAGTQQATLHLNLAEGASFLEVEDGGLGFDPQAAREQQGHLGLAGMAERARELGWSLSIESRLGCGTRIRVAENAPGGAE